jgi:hypothetical protein
MFHLRDHVIYYPLLLDKSCKMQSFIWVNSNIKNLVKPKIVTAEFARRNNFGFYMHMLFSFHSLAA